jgi:uncharacterized phage protein (TIGR02220 family)
MQEVTKKIKIIINNWTKYQTRKDLKTMSWFRLNSDLPEHPAFFELTNEGKWFTVWLFCLCAKNCSEELNTNIKYMAYYSKVSEKEILKALPILSDHAIIRYESVTNPTRKRDVPKTKETTNTTRNYNEEAKVILKCLNDTTGRNYREIDTNLKKIISLLKTDLTYDDFETVIFYKYKKWFNDPEMTEYLRPSTLFGKEKFEQYLAPAWSWRKEQEEKNKEKIKNG